MKKLYFSVLGDSISTYEGYVPRGYPVFYMLANRYEASLSTVHDTWWGQVIRHFDGALMKNDSWSGSLTVERLEEPAFSCGCSAERTGNLGAQGEKPDILLLFMGTNDCGWRVPLQSEDKRDMGVFENAYDTMLSRVRENYPEAEVFCLTVYRKSCAAAPQYQEREEHIEMAERYCEVIRSAAKRAGCHVVELHDGNVTVDTIDGLHPSLDGMTAIARAVIHEMEQSCKRLFE